MRVVIAMSGRDDWNVPCFDPVSRQRRRAVSICLSLFPNYHQRDQKFHSLSICAVIRSAADIMASSSFVPRTVLSVSFLFGVIVYAQSSASTPTQSFTPGSPTCSNGLATPSSPGGTYTDFNGALWNIQCGQDNNGGYYDTGGTNGHGFSACFNGCDERPGCTGFSFQGAVTGKW